MDVHRTELAGASFTTACGNHLIVRAVNTKTATVTRTTSNGAPPTAGSTRTPARSKRFPTTNKSTPVRTIGQSRSPANHNALRFRSRIARHATTIAVPQIVATTTITPTRTVHVRSAPPAMCRPTTISSPPPITAVKILANGLAEKTSATPVQRHADFALEARAAPASITT